MFALFAIFLSILGGCCTSRECFLGEDFATGGGRDAVTINLPFAEGDSHRCSQGANGAYSHQGTSTRYDADFDTPNDADDIVYAPVGGIVYVHDSDPYTNFGYHVNIDQGDGTYIIMAHLSSIFVEDESEVAAGQLIGFEGTTGNSTGDHLHIGRHSGDAEDDGIYGTSQEGLEFSASDATLASAVESIPVTDLVCDVTSGHFYTSVLPVPLWHPNGTLVKTPSDSAVYLVEGGVARTFLTEESFLSRNYDFASVTLISDAELDCLGNGSSISDSSEVMAVYDDEDESGLWLLSGSETASDRMRQKVATTGWQGVLKSWGINASTYDDLPRSSDLDGLLARYPVQSDATSYRDGTLVSPSDASDVYLVSDGIAMPVETWNTFLLAGFWSRTVLEVERSEFESVASVRGSCATDTYCLTESDLTVCGGPDAESEGVFETAGSESEEDTSEPEESGADDSDTLTLTWSTPSSQTASRITLSGEYTPEGGGAQGWSGNLAESTSSTSVTYTRDMSEGDSLRFSIEYVIGSSTSWSCLAPFPPGTVQGTSTATWHGKSQTVSAADDPASDGCGLMVTMSE
jgi:hypothetical protein